jgi:hypothetical protein
MMTETANISRSINPGRIKTDYWETVKDAFLWAIEADRDAIVEEARRAGCVESGEDDVSGLLLALESYDAQLGVVFFLRENPDVLLSDVRRFERAAREKIERDLPLDEEEARSASKIARGVIRMF